MTIITYDLSKVTFSLVVKTFDVSTVTFSMAIITYDLSRVTFSMAGRGGSRDDDDDAEIN